MDAQQQGTLLVPQFNYLATLKKMAAAGCAASVAEVVSIPMDTTKVRLQIQGESGAGPAASQNLKYRGMTHAIFTICKEEGIPKALVKILASCTTASTAVLLFQPTEVVKIRMQAAGAQQVYAGAAAAYSTIARCEGIKGLWK